MAKGYFIRSDRETVLCEAIQKRLFSKGYRWGCGGGTNVNRDSHGFYYINNFGDKYITRDNGEFSGKEILDELSLDDLFRDDFWNRHKVKEMTVAEVSKELGYDVKIVK